MSKSFDRNSYSSGRRSQSTRSGSSGNASSATDNPRYRAARSAVPAAAEGSANPYSRSAYGNTYAKERKRKKRNKIIGVCLTAVVLVIAAGGIAAAAFLQSIQTNFQEGIDEELLEVLASPDASVAEDPFYMLLMGTDGSADRAAMDEFQGDTFRTDSIMLVRIDPRQKIVSIVSLMRDTMVDMDEYGTQKLNAAHALGGPAYAVQVVEELAGVDISHYAEVDFDGFRDIVNALGGVEVNVPVEIDDDEAGGYLAAGEQVLNGDQALILCRSRHTYDDYGKKGDEFRAANQRLVISAIVRKLLESDLPTMVSTVQAMSKQVTTDMSVNSILTLANSMRGIDMDNGFYTAVNPTESQYIDDIWWEVMDEAAWKKMMNRVDQGLSPTEESDVDEDTGVILATAGGATPSGGEAGATGQTTTPKIVRSGTVAIRNGSEIDGAAAAAQAKIDEIGYTTDVANADSSDYPTTLVIYETDDERERAEELVGILGCGQAVRNDGVYLYATDFLVVIGGDWPQS